MGKAQFLLSLAPASKPLAPGSLLGKLEAGNSAIAHATHL